MFAANTPPRPNHFAVVDQLRIMSNAKQLQILSNPQTYNKLQSECSSASVELSKVISQSQALRLPYLQACIKEALRHNPSATGFLPRVVIKAEGDMNEGIWLPPGTEVGLSSWSLQRMNTAVYGDDAAVFRPERWLEAPAERLDVMEETLNLVFAYGRNRCLGENIARIELNKVFFELLRRFDWSVVDPMRPFEQNDNHGLWLQQGFWVRVTERNT